MAASLSLALRCENTSSSQARVGEKIRVATLSPATLHHTKSELLGLPDVLGSRRACRGHLPTWQVHRCGPTFPYFRRVPQPNRIDMPRLLTPILSASQKPKREEPPIRRLGTT